MLERCIVSPSVSPSVTPSVSSFAPGKSGIFLLVSLFAPLFALVLAGSVPAGAAVPTYRLDVVATYDVATSLRGASDAGHLVGDQTVDGLIRAFVATQDTGLVLLPLPEGYLTSTALDANDAGVVVGAVATGTLPFDLGEPAIWTPDGVGGYTVDIPEQFTTMSSPLGELAINGGMAVAVNTAGTVVGWSRFQGFQGGPSTLFSTTGAPVDLRDFGFEATVRDLSESGIVVGGRLRLDLDTGLVTDIGLPDPIQPGNVGFTQAIAYAVNDAGETVVAADLASVPTENWLTYIHDDTGGYRALDPAQLPAPFVGFYDNNDRGDVSATGGVYFAAEDVLLPGFTGLLAPEFAAWQTSLGFIADDRRVFTSALDGDTGQNALVVLSPPSLFTDGFEDGTTEAWSLVVP